MPVVETLRYRDGALEMLDQRALPETCVYLRFGAAADTAAGIRDMVIRGAPAIGCAAAYGIALEAQRLVSDPTNFLRELEKGFLVLAASRPTAVNLFWALDEMRATLAKHQSAPREAIATALLARAHEIHADDIRACKAMGAHGAALLKDGARVLTHCNAGALATAGHGTALGVIRSAVESGKRISVIADETRPYLQGARLTAWEMQQEGIPVTLITDNMAGHLMKSGEVDAVIVGADRIARNGDAANKIGTYMVAVLAHRHGIPFYVAAPCSTIDLTMVNGDGIPIEERPASEVHGFRDMVWAPRGVAVRNPSFDVTPSELISAIITERGVVRAPYSDSVPSLFKESADG